MHHLLEPKTLSNGMHPTLALPNLSFPTVHQPMWVCWSRKLNRIWIYWKSQSRIIFGSVSISHPAQRTRSVVGIRNISKSQIVIWISMNRLVCRSIEVQVSTSVSPCMDLYRRCFLGHCIYRVLINFWMPVVLLIFLSLPRTLCVLGFALNLHLLF